MLYTFTTLYYLVTSMLYSEQNNDYVHIKF
ncbi:MAG: hypothetical protein ACJATN_000942 [Neolewinella sp.]|jgi:hypothetical protein